MQLILDLAYPGCATACLSPKHANIKPTREFRVLRLTKGIVYQS